MKKYIPNIITTYRLGVALLIPILFFLKFYNVLTVLLVTAILSDFIDGMLARVWNVTSLYGKICDMIGDKLLAIIASSTFSIAINKYFIVTFVLELIIIIINCINVIKSKSLKNKDFSSHNSSIYGKTKTWFLFTSLLVAYISLMYSPLEYAVTPLIILTTIMQLITALNYAKVLSN